MKKLAKLSFAGSIALAISSVFSIALGGIKMAYASGSNPDVKCIGIANDENNNILEPASSSNPVAMYRTLIRYDAQLGPEKNNTNVVSTTGQGIKLNGVPLSEISSAVINYSHGSTYLNIKIPQRYQDNLLGNVTLEVVEGTQFESKTLDASKFMLKTGKWNKVNDVTFDKITWNNTAYNEYKDMKGVLLSYSKNLSSKQSEIDGGIRMTNFADSVGEHIYLDGQKLSTLPGAFVGYYALNFMFIYADNMPSYRSVSIEDKTLMCDAILPATNLYFNTTSNEWSLDQQPHKNVVFSKIQWNDIGYNEYASMKGVLLNYDKDLSNIRNEIDGNVKSINYAKSVGEHILLGGQKLSTLPGAFVGYYALNFIFIYCDNMPTYRTLKIEDGTIFMDSILPELTLYYGSKTKWSTEKEPLPAITFQTILWNNKGLEEYAGKNGILLAYSDNISNAMSEINGGVRLVNQVNETIGEKISLDGTYLKDIIGAEIMYFGGKYLWIYAPSMDTYKELKVESCEFMTSMLPETHFAFIGNEWAESLKITNIVNGEEVIDYVRKDVQNSVGSEYYEGLYAGTSLSSKLLTYSVDGYSYDANQTVTITADKDVIATVVGFETTKGASIKMTDPSNIRFETKIDKKDYDYLVYKYGANNVELGTYIIKKSSLGYEDYDKYFNNPLHIEGTDYFKSICEGFTNKPTSSMDGYYKYLGSLEEVLSNNFSEEYCGIGYLKVTEGDSDYTIYGVNKLDSFSRSVYEVAKRAYARYANNSPEQEALASYLDGVLPLITNETGIAIDTNIEGYTSPYSLAFNSENGEYVITGATELKTVLINGEKRMNNGSVINIDGVCYKVSDYSQESNNESSKVSFKLVNMPQASNLVDFTVNLPVGREMKILQLTDTQIIDSSQMRSPTRLNPTAIEMWSRGKIDQNCFNFVAQLIEDEHPDLIILTGDNVYGEFDDSGEIWTLFIDFMDSFGIPWAPIFGNHDNESTKGVEWQCEQLEKANNCLFKRGNVTGYGNYSIGLVDQNGQIQRVLYMMDSGGCGRGAGLVADQLNWMKGVSATIDAAYGTKIPGFACYHIASLDFKEAYQNKYGYDDSVMFNLDIDGRDGDMGQKNEKVSLFPTAIASDLKAANVDGVFIGHDHSNNYSIDYEGIRYTYGTKSSTYDMYKVGLTGGTLITVKSDYSFEVEHKYIKESDMKNRECASLTVTFMSDLHFDTANYGGFHCLKSEAKLNKILDETPESRFYINLGDTVNSMNGTFNNYYQAMSVMKQHKLNIFNSEGSGYTNGNRMMYNLLGNHEVAYSYKRDFKEYAPYVEGIGSAAVFKYEDLLFVAVDAIYDRNGYDAPEDINPPGGACTKFTIPNKEISWLKEEVSKNMDTEIRGIVWISHIALQDIDAESQNKLLGELKGYGLPMTVFEGHTHVENYRELIDDVTGKVYCQVYTLPAVVLNENYPYYNITFKNGKVWYADKRTSGVID